MISPYTAIASRRMLKQGKMGGGIRDCLEIVPVGEVVGIDQRGRGLDKRETILKTIPLLDCERSGAECFDVFHLKAMLLKSSLHQVEESCCPWHRCFPYLHAVGEIKESPLKPAIVTQGLMEESAPAWIGKITIDRNEEVDTERAAHVVTLHAAAIGHEVGKVCAHPFVKGSHPRHWCQLERHEIAKMDCGKSCQQPMDRLRMATVKRVVQYVWPKRRFHRQMHGVML